MLLQGENTMAAVNYRETATAIAENDGGISEFGYNPNTGKVEFETAEGREIGISPAEIVVYGEDQLYEEDLALDEVQETMESIEELYMEAEGQDTVGKLTGNELEPADVDTIQMEDGEFDYPEEREARLKN